MRNKTKKKMKREKEGDTKYKIFVATKTKIFHKTFYGLTCRTHELCMHYRKLFTIFLKWERNRRKLDFGWFIKELVNQLLSDWSSRYSRSIRLLHTVCKYGEWWRRYNFLLKIENSYRIQHRLERWKHSNGLNNLACDDLSAVRLILHFLFSGLTLYFNIEKNVSFIYIRESDWAKMGLHTKSCTRSMDNNILDSWNILARSQECRDEPVLLLKFFFLNIQSVASVFIPVNSSIVPF